MRLFKFECEAYKAASRITERRTVILNEGGDILSEVETTQFEDSWYHTPTAPRTLVLNADSIFFGLTWDEKQATAIAVPPAVQALRLGYQKERGFTVTMSVADSGPPQSITITLPPCYFAGGLSSGDIESRVRQFVQIKAERDELYPWIKREADRS